MKLNAKPKFKVNSFESQFHPYQYKPKPKLVYGEITDAEGLSKAYKHGDYYVHGKTMFIAGSHTTRDWFDDITKIPVWGDVRESDRYQKVLKEFVDRNEIDTVVGHSLGGSVSLELQKTILIELKRAGPTGHR